MLLPQAAAQKSAARGPGVVLEVIVAAVNDFSLRKPHSGIWRGGFSPP
jgi:hypothetical protein